MDFLSMWLNGIIAITDNNRNSASLGKKHGVFNKFPDFFCRGIQNCRRLFKIQYGIAIHLMRWMTNLYDFSFKLTATAAIGIHPIKAWLSQLVNFKNAIWTLEEQYAIKFCFKLGKDATETYGMLQIAFRPSCMNHTSVFAWRKRFKEGRKSVRDDERLGVRKSIHQSWLTKGLGLGLLCWRLKGVQEEIPWEEAGTLQIGSVANRVSCISTRTMHQSTTSSLSQTISPRCTSRQFLSLPIDQTLLPATFGYSLSSQAVVMRQLRRWNRLWQRSLARSHKRTSMGPCRSCWNGKTSALQPEEIPSKGTRVSCVYYE